LNNLSAGQSLQVGSDTFECLQLAAQMYSQTAGAFDVTVGSLMDCWLNKDKTPRQPTDEQLNQARRRTGMHLLKLNEADYSVQVLADHIRIDLGGIGKGFAVDRMAALLREWGIRDVLISGGGSSVLARGSPQQKEGWPVTLRNPFDSKEILTNFCISDRSLSGSGVRAGQHIMDPRTAKPIEDKAASWASAADAATADAISTAFMVMTPERIERYCSKYLGTLALIVTDKILWFGRWPKSDRRL
jgi:thiamine biosynthesis lipoprotein